MTQVFVIKHLMPNTPWHSHDEDFSLHGIGRLRAPVADALALHWGHVPGLASNKHPSRAALPVQRPPLAQRPSVRRRGRLSRKQPEGPLLQVGQCAIDDG
jgi:hypothetical protein